MKKTVSFFNNCKKYISKSIKASLGTVLVILVWVMMGINILKNPSYISGLIAFGTNIREVNKREYSVTDYIKAYPVFNGDNYIVQDIAKKDNVEKVQKEENIGKKEVFDASAVDVVSNIITIDKSNLKIKETKNYTRVDLYGVTILDYSSKKIDYEELMNKDIILTKKSDPVLLYCTHTSETYKNSEKYKFKYTGNYRTKEAEYNMLSVADILKNTLIERGITTVFDTTPHDYTSYDNAYKNSMKTINKNLEKTHFGVMIDVHRDAYADLNYAPTTKINGKSTAQLMLVIGVGYESLENKYWKENLSLALQIVKKGEEMYPGLFRHILVRDSRYNQHLAAGSILIEVGATGNTLEEAYYGARCLGNILSELYK